MEHTEEAEVLDSLTVNDTTHVEQPRKLSTNEKEFPSTNYEADHILNWRAKRAQCLVMSIEICGICCIYICMDVFFRNRYVVTKLLEVNGCACPMKELLPGRLKKKQAMHPLLF